MLGGLRVLELVGRDIWGASAAAHCGRILADLGADVVKAEPPDGDPVRRVPPYLGERADDDRGLLWIALNANKRGVVLDHADVRRRDALVRDADVVVQASVVIDPARADPRLVLVTVTPYGATGPLAETPASDLEVTAASGSLWLAGEPGGPPVRTSLPQSPFWTGMYAATGALLAVIARRRTGRGQHVDVSGQQSMVTVHPPASVFADIAHEEHMRLGPNLLGRSIVGARFRNIWPCADGHVSFAIQGGPIGRHTGRMLASDRLGELRQSHALAGGRRRARVGGRGIPGDTSQAGVLRGRDRPQHAWLSRRRCARHLRRRAAESARLLAGGDDRRSDPRLP